MITAQYLHCSSIGSYYIDCEILEKRNYDFSKDATWLDNVCTKQGLPSSNHSTDVGYVVKYVDPITDKVVTRWTEEGYVKIPKFVGPI